MHVIVIRKNVTGILLIELCEALCTFDNGDGDDDDDHHGHFDDDEDGDLGRCWLDADDALFLLLPLMTIVMMMVGIAAKAAGTAWRRNVTRRHFRRLQRCSRGGDAEGRPPPEPRARGPRSERDVANDVVFGVVAVDLLFNHDRLDMEVSEAFRRSVYHPAWKRLRYYSDSTAPEARSPAKSWRLQDRTLERQFSLSCYFTEAATRELEISRMQALAHWPGWRPMMQKEAGVKATDDPVSNALVAWMAHSLRVQKGAEELVHLSRGRPFGYAIGKPEVSEWLLPVFVEHDRSSHAERMAQTIRSRGKGSYFHKIVLYGCVKSAGAKLHPDSSVSGMVAVYATHTPCISCMAVFCQFKQKLPGVKLYVCFDKWGETNRWIAEEVRALPQV
ncbi:hypothetical protein AK812_SmicGene22593 [Symbiodinium microadriaticum]|uniref:CMP/dCMP-type deaminase domain-containing protein n=1 Tax=Symbiodinium microadriaticum TaxID=2951 RepID=A0A1Q9DJE6_SYMMI|nr:hypothetical protein AK812_SmicGene22593 [Symbiodinium microadriaticum]